MSAPTWTQDEIVQACPTELKRRGHEYAGPCPCCGGDDRFYISCSCS